MKTADGETAAESIILNSEQQKELIELFEKSYVRKKIFRKDYVNSNAMGYLIVLSDNPDTVYFLSTDIISVNGTQYKVYGQALPTGFKAVIEDKK